LTANQNDLKDIEHIAYGMIGNISLVIAACENILAKHPELGKPEDNLLGTDLEKITAMSNELLKKLKDFHLQVFEPE